MWVVECCSKLLLLLLSPSFNVFLHNFKIQWEEWQIALVLNYFTPVSTINYWPGYAVWLHSHSSAHATQCLKRKGSVTDIDLYWVGDSIDSPVRDPETKAHGRVERKWMLTHCLLDIISRIVTLMKKTLFDSTTMHICRHWTILCSSALLHSRQIAFPLGMCQCDYLVKCVSKKGTLCTDGMFDIHSPVQHSPWYSEVNGGHSSRWLKKHLAVIIDDAITA